MPPCNSLFLLKPVACLPPTPDFAAPSSTPSVSVPLHSLVLQVRAKVIIDGHLNPNIVGQSVQSLAKIFEINVPQSAKVWAAGGGGRDVRAQKNLTPRRGCREARETRCREK